MKRKILLPVLPVAVLVIALGTLWGCASFRPDIGSPDPSTFAIRLRTGADIRCIDSPSWTPEETALLRRWTSELGKGGKVSFDTFAPGLVIAGDGFNANFLPGGNLVLNARSATGRNWTQLIRKQTDLDAAVFAAAKAKCSSPGGGAAERTDAAAIADRVWAFAQMHPDGFTIDVRTMAEPVEGIAVSYAATQNSHSRETLGRVVDHALRHDGYAGGWYNPENGLYYFDSTRLFPEDRLEDALRFGRENGQHAVYILSTGTEVTVDAGAPATSP